MWPPPRASIRGMLVRHSSAGGEVVDLGDLAQVLVGRVSEGSGRPDAGIVYQNVDRTGFVLNLTDQGGDLGRIRQVGRMRGASQFGRERMNGVP